MSKHETPMLRQYWHSVGGTLIEEFQVVGRGPGHEHRRIDGVILPEEADRIASAADVEIQAKPVIVVQVKAMRLGMNVMGQTLFSAMLMRRWNPASVRAVAVCREDDAQLRPLLEQFPGAEVRVLSG